LKDAGLVSERREGTRRLYRLRREGLDEVTRIIEAFWDDGLARLKAEAERQEVALREREQS
jgi:DNA-binding transcriptional ArsR family regulator